MNYTEDKNALSQISSKYACKGDIIMRTAIQYILQYGQSSFADEEFLAKQIASVDKRHDEAEANGETLWISRDFEIELLRCAADLAQIETYSLIIFMQKEMYWSEEGGPDYERLKDIAEDLINWIVSDSSDSSQDYETLSDYCHISDEELEYIGFKYLIPKSEEED